jgi:adenylylsulfate kinase
MSGSGKSTLAEKIKSHFENLDFKVLLLDGDVLRSRLHLDLGFSKENILENNKRIVGLCHESLAQNDIVIVAVITPYQKSRQNNRSNFGEKLFEIYVKASIELLTKRDVKGLYKKALRGEIKNFIGIDPAVPFEKPENPDLVIDSENENIKHSVARIIATIS